MTLSPLGDSAVVMTLGDIIDEAMTARVHALAAEIERHRFPAVTDVVPAFASVAVFYDLAQLGGGGFESFCAGLREVASRADSAVVSDSSRRIEVPVCYRADFGPDLEEVAKANALSADEVVRLHCSGDYLVHAIGFAPGFPYLGGLPPRLATPRRATPRALVPAGSVGIGGGQTGIYPLPTPGGWNIIGRTPLRLFDPARAEPALLRAGDHVSFHAISAEDFRVLDYDAGALRCAPEIAGHETASGDRAAGGAIEVRKAGLFTTVQDTGRTGFRAQGVALGGAADPFAVRLLNALVGNAENAAVLEFTLIGPELVISHDTIVAVGGADFAGLPRWRPLAVAAGTTLQFGHARAGCRGYLAIAGGIDVPVALRSRSTLVRAGVGGLQGRTLRDRDRLPVPVVRRALRNHWHIDERVLPSYSSSPVLRVIPGAQAPEFGDTLWGGAFTVTSHSDRMGVRLTGAPVVRSATRDLLSSPVAPGTVQVPPDGQPIVLLADAQSIGGYPQVAHVISVDLPLVAQLRPGDAVRFKSVSLAEAHELALARERAFAMLREGLAEKITPTWQEPSI